jgi:hypothetical protein
MEGREEDLDAVLAFIPGQAADEILSEASIPVLDALARQKGLVAGLAWTPARVGALMTRLPDAGRLQGPLYSVLYYVSYGEKGAFALAEALVDRASLLRKTGGELNRLAQLVTQERELAWHSRFAERATARWPGISVEGKIALLEIASESLGLRSAFLKGAADALRKEAMARETDPELRIAIVGALRTLGADGFVASMRELLIESKSPIRLRAVRLLRAWSADKIPELLPAAKELVTDESAEVRLWAIGRLGEWDNFEASPYLVKALADPDESVRAAAAVGLARVGREDAVPPLVKLLDDPNAVVREKAFAALEQIQKIIERKRAWQLEQAGLR